MCISPAVIIMGDSEDDTRISAPLIFLGLQFNSFNLAKISPYSGTIKRNNHHNLLGWPGAWRIRFQDQVHPNDCMGIDFILATLGLGTLIFQMKNNSIPWTSQYCGKNKTIQWTNARSADGDQNLNDGPSKQMILTMPQVVSLIQSQILTKITAWHYRGPG